MNMTAVAKLLSNYLGQGFQRLSPQAIKNLRFSDFKKGEFAELVPLLHAAGVTQVGSIPRTDSKELALIEKSILFLLRYYYALTNFINRNNQSRTADIETAKTQDFLDYGGLGDFSKVLHHHETSFSRDLDCTDSKWLYYTNAKLQMRGRIAYTSDLDRDGKLVCEFFTIKSNDGSKKFIQVSKLKEEELAYFSSSLEPKLNELYSLLFND